MSRRLPAVVVALACGLAPASPSAEAAHWLVPKLLDAETYAETFSAIADLHDGTYVQVQMAVTNVGPGSGKGACRALVVPPGGKAWTDQENFDRDEWRFEAGPPAALHIGRCTLSARPDALDFDVRLADSRVRVVLKMAASRHAPPGHRIEADGDFYDSVVLVPWADARVDLTVPGGPKRRGMTGRGFSDRSRSTALPGDVANRWVRVRALAGDAAQLVLARFPPDGGRVDGWRWDVGWGAARRLDHLALTPRGAIRERGAWHVKVGGLGPVEYTSAELIHRNAPVEDQGVLGALVGAVIGNPVTYTYRIPGGVMEVTIVDE